MATKKFITKNGLLTNTIQYVDEIGDTTQSITASMNSLGSLSFDGSSGQLFSITDDLTGSLFSVNDISGIPSIEVIDFHKRFRAYWMRHWTSIFSKLMSSQHAHIFNTFYRT